MRTGLLLGVCFLVASLLGCIFQGVVSPAPVQGAFEAGTITTATRWSTSQWNATWSGLYADCGYAVATGDGNVYMGGETYGGAVRHYDALLAKYGQDGVEAWNRTWGGTGNEVVHDIVVASGKACIVGETTSFSSNSSAFIACYGEDGGLLWSHVWSEVEGTLNGVSTDGSAFYTGGELMYGSVDYPYIVKYFLNGTQAWQNLDYSNVESAWIDDIAVNGTMVYSIGTRQASTAFEWSIWRSSCSTGGAAPFFTTNGGVTGWQFASQIGVVANYIYAIGTNNSANYLYRIDAAANLDETRSIEEVEDMQATGDGVFTVGNRATPEAINVTCFDLGLITFSTKIWSTTSGTLGKAITVGDEGVYVSGVKDTLGFYDALIFKYSAIGGPTDITYTHGTPNHPVNWTIGAGSIVPSQYSVVLDGVEIRNGIFLPSTTISIDAAGLDVGTHVYALLVNLNGTAITDQVLVHVVNGNPAISAVSSISYQHGTVGHTISFTIIDSSTSSTWYDVLCDGATIHSGTWLNGTAITLSVDGLAIGTHVFNVTARDGLAGTAMQSATVTVTAAAPPAPTGTDPAIIGLYVLVIAALVIVVLQLMLPMLVKKKERSP